MYSTKIEMSACNWRATGIRDNTLMIYNVVDGSVPFFLNFFFAFSEAVNAKTSPKDLSHAGPCSESKDWRLFPSL